MPHSFGLEGLDVTQKRLMPLPYRQMHLCAFNSYSLQWVDLG